MAIGVPAAGGGSSLMISIQDDVIRVGACKALLMYNRADGKVLNGLTTRRHFEYQRCISELG